MIFPNDYLVINVGDIVVELQTVVNIGDLAMVRIPHSIISCCPEYGSLLNDSFNVDFEPEQEVSGTKNWNWSTPKLERINIVRKLHSCKSIII